MLLSTSGPDGGRLSLNLPHQGVHRKLPIEKEVNHPGAGNNSQWMYIITKP